MFLLRNRAPKRFAADSLNTGNASTRSQLARLKREWRKEWEEEMRVRLAEEDEEALRTLDAKLDAMRARHEEAQRLELEWREEDETPED